MIDMTEKEAIEEINIYKNNDCTDRFLERALEIAISDIKRVEELEKENKKLKEGIENIKTEIDALETEADMKKSDDDYELGSFWTYEKVLDLIDENLGEVLGSKEQEQEEGEQERE